MRTLFLIVFSCWILAVFGQESLYVIVAPSGDGVDTSKSFIVEIKEGNVIPVKDIDSFNGIEAMFLAKNAKKLIVLGAGKEGGFVSTYGLQAGFPRKNVEIPISMSLGMFFLDRDPIDIFSLKVVDLGKQYRFITFHEVTGLTDEIGLGNVGSDPVSYSQTGPFAQYLNVTVDRITGMIQYYAGTERWPSSYVIPSSVLSLLSKNIEEYDWIGFASNTDILAFKGMDRKTDSLTVVILDKSSKKWYVRSFQGYRSYIWANERGFAIRKELKSLEKGQFQDRDISLWDYKLEQSWKVKLNSTSAMLSWERDKIILRMRDGLYVGYFGTGSTLAQPTLYVKDPLLERAQAAFVLVE